jgi:hypothetical protein
MALAKGGQAGNQAASAVPGKAASQCADGWQGWGRVWLKSRFSMSERKKARGVTGLSYFPKGEIEETGTIMQQGKIC